ncbi:MAG: TolC family protein [Bdellovibrionales bacterium]|nr:TolC family protein [Bdellovibrionales bacterium]
MRRFGILSLLLVARVASAEAVDFRTVWSEVRGAASGLRAAESAKVAQEGESQIAGRHWLPRVYLGAKVYQTNDPGAAFFGLLSERAVTSADFDPARLNHPDAKTYTMGSVGVDLPLYEGGLRSANGDMQKELLVAADEHVRVTEIEHYAEAARIYGMCLAGRDRERRLLRVRDDLDELLKRYELGSKANPVGYSGLLGLKTLRNRVVGLLAETRAKTLALGRGLEAMGFRRAETWTPEKTNVSDFIATYLREADGADSARVREAQLKAGSMERVVQMEAARTLPRVGVFGEQSFAAGDRDRANGYTAGLYLQWNIFDPSDSGRSSTARSRAVSARYQVDAMAANERAEGQAMAAAAEALDENLKLMVSSEELLDEQAKVAATLFRNGSISALQMVEVASRRTDLIVDRSEAESRLVEVKAERVKRSSSLPSSVNGGVK